MVAGRPWIAYFSESRASTAQSARPDRNGRGQKSPSATATFFTNPVWSPDSKKIAYTDQHLNLWYADVATGKSVKVDTNPFGTPDDVLSPSWSPDSKWIGYVRQLRESSPRRFPLLAGQAARRVSSPTA